MKSAVSAAVAPRDAPLPCCLAFHDDCVTLR